MLVRLIKLVVVGWIVGMIAGSLAALSMKRRLVPTTDESADEIVAVAIFAPLAFHSTATAFRGGALECWYGGGVLDLRDAVLAPEGATLRVRAVFGGGQILVPADWHVVIRVRGMGGIGDTRPGEGLQGRRAGARHRGHGDRRRVRRDVGARRGRGRVARRDEGQDRWQRRRRDQPGRHRDGCVGCVGHLGRGAGTRHLTEVVGATGVPGSG